MTYEAIEAVWFWRFSDAPFKATYGRFPGTKFTKDFLQASGECGKAFDEIFGRAPGATIPIAFRWPGGSLLGGSISEQPADHDPPRFWRLNIRWPTSGNAPEPWRLTSVASESRTFPGNPDASNEQLAEAELAAFEARNLDPWILAIKLRGEHDALHVRAYAGSPSVDLERASLRYLPIQLRTAIRDLPGNFGCGVVRFEGTASIRDPDLLRDTLNALRHNPNVLLIGPPATGKSVVLEDVKALFEQGLRGAFFDASRMHDAWFDLPTLGWTAGQQKVRAVVFHASYSYEEFVLGLMPKVGAGIALEARPGPLLSLAHWSSEPTNHALMLIDEFNRGNAAAIFGDTLALLDKDKRRDLSVGRAGTVIDRAYPQTDVDVTAEYGITTGTAVARQLTFPANLWIVAALNSSDRSVAPLDAAMRRRFSIVRSEPNYELLARRYGIPPRKALPKDRPASDWTRADVLGLAIEILQVLNERIESVVGADFLLGHGLLWDVDGEDATRVIQALSWTFDERVVSTLRITFADQDEALAAILGAGSADSARRDHPVATASGYWIAPPERVIDVGHPRLRLQKLGGLSADEGLRLLVSITT